MNKQRREELDKIKSDLEGIKERISNCASEEREYYDGMPESLQSGEKGEKADAAANALEECESSIDDIITKIEEASE